MIDVYADTLMQFYPSLMAENESNFCFTACCFLFIAQK